MTEHLRYILRTDDLVREAEKKAQRVGLIRNGEDCAEHYTFVRKVPPGQHA